MRKKEESSSSSSEPQSFPAIFQPRLQRAAESAPSRPGEGGSERAREAGGGRAAGGRREGGAQAPAAAGPLAAGAGPQGARASRGSHPPPFPAQCVAPGSSPAAPGPGGQRPQPGDGSQPAARCLRSNAGSPLLLPTESRCVSAGRVLTRQPASAQLGKLRPQKAEDLV